MNVENLKIVRNLIAENKTRLDLLVYHSDDKNIQHRSWTLNESLNECGTAMCIAGWCTYASGEYGNQKVPTISFYDAGKEFLEIDKTDADYLFWGLWGSILFTTVEETLEYLDECIEKRCVVRTDEE